MTAETTLDALRIQADHLLVRLRGGSDPADGRRGGAAPRRLDSAGHRAPPARRRRRPSRDDAGAGAALPARAVPAPPRRHGGAAPADAGPPGRRPGTAGRTLRGPRRSCSRSSTSCRTPSPATAWPASPTGRCRTSAGRWRRSASISPPSRCASTARSIVAALAALADAPPELEREVVPGVAAGEVLATFRAMAAAQRRFGEAACRRYVISFTEGPRDVRDVLELAALAADPAIPVASTSGLAAGAPILDVVPLFESADALHGARRILDALLADPLPGPPAGPGGSPGGDARLLGLEQGIRLPGRALAALPGPGAARRRGPRGGRGADDLPRSRRGAGAGRGPHPPGRAGRPGRARWPGGSSSPSRAR